METLYLVLLIIFIIGMIGSGIVVTVLSLDEKNVKEVTTEWLHKMGKDYSKEEFENTMFNQYVNIEYAKTNDDYNQLKDVVSDEEYNKILLDVKKDREQELKKVVDKINKGFSKLIGFKMVKDQEVAKLWVQYSCVEYVKGYREELNEETNLMEKKEVIVSGSDTKPVFHEYVVTFVKERSTVEKVVCPSCGREYKLLLRSKCQICDTIIVPKTKHWVYVNKKIANINKK